MFKAFILIFIGLELFCNCVKAKHGYGTGEQNWGYFDIRKGAHMFYWLHYTTATPNYVERPLVLWLQGGPGQSSTGYGNFKEIGPLDIHGNERNSTWIQDVNVLFIDSPVGSGFSYVDDEYYLTTSSQQIAKDLVTFMEAFFKKYTDFKQVPLHIFGESYGGKIAAQFALELYYAMQRKELSCNLTSVVLISPAISIEDEVVAYAPYLLNNGVVDDDGYNEIMKAANKTKELIDAEKWNQSWEQWSETLDIISRKSWLNDFENIARPQYIKSNETSENSDEILTQLMQETVSKRLAIPSGVKWEPSNSATYWSLRADMMMPAVNVVRELLDKTDLQVGVVAGQFDLIIALPGTVNWINKMEWSYKDEYVEAPRNGINVNGTLEGYEKTARKFSMFWIYRAGHMVPADNPKAMKYILRKFTNFG